MSRTEELASNLRKMYETLVGEDLAKEIGSLFSADAEATAFTGGDDAWAGRDEIFEHWLLPEFTRHPGFHKVVGRVWVEGHRIAIFHKNRCRPSPDSHAEWLGLDLYRTGEDGMRLVHARFCSDTVARSELDRVVNADAFWGAIDARWSPTTTAGNRVGMRQVIELKSIAGGSSTERYEHLLSLIEPDAELWSWEPDELVHLRGREAIENEFVAPLLPLLPDFYEALEEAIVFGNALVMIQNPSGTFTTADGRRVFSAWYNCDVYLFREERIECLLFGRDTLKDRRQMLAALGGEAPAIEDSLHLSPFRDQS